MNLLEGQNLIVIGIAALIFLCLGGVAGWLLAQLGTDSGEKQSTPPVADDQASEPIPPPSPPNPDKIELARIYRHRQSQQVFLEADNRPIRTPMDIGETERRWLLPAVQAMNLLLGQEISRTPTQIEPGQPNVDKLQPPVAPLPRLDQPQFQKPSMNPANILIRAVQASQVKIDRTKTLAGQIDDVLQEMLEKSPLPVGDVHLVDHPGLGLEVWVGMLKYDGIEAVPDESVRQIIRAATEEWQRRSQRPTTP